MTLDELGAQGIYSSLDLDTVALVLDIFVFAVTIVSVIYGVHFFFVKGEGGVLPKFVTLAIACDMLGLVQNFIFPYTGHSIDAPFELIVFGTIGCFLCLFSAYFVSPELEIDKSIRLSKSAKILRIFISGSLIIAYLPAFFSDDTLLSKITNGVAAVLAAASVYLSVTYLLIPKEHKSRFSAYKLFNIRVIVFAISVMLEYVFYRLAFVILLIAAHIIEAVFTVLLLPSFRKGAK